MAYTLQAIIGSREVLASVSGALPLVRLPQEMLLLPLTEAVREQRGIPHLPLTAEDSSAFPDCLSSLCRDLSANGEVAYVEAEFFGGHGTQAAVLAKHGQVVGEPMVSRRAINDALAFLGVLKGDAHDEFDALGLGKERDTERWAAKPGVA